MSPVYEDTVFHISKAAQTRLREGAKQSGLAVPTYFRAKASQLVRIAGPEFHIPGDHYFCRVKVGVSARVLEGLHELCRDLGVDFANAGELVACATFEPALRA